MKTIITKHLSIALFILMTSLTISCRSGEATAEVKIQDPADVLDTIFMNRKSVRKYTDQQVTDDQLLKVLWAANGINREDGKRTAPSAVNAQDIELYLCISDGAYHYDPQTKQLQKVGETDIRPTIAGHNEFILNLPVILLVSNQSRFERFGSERGAKFGAMDAGYVSQNICLYCTASGLATVPCAPYIDIEAIKAPLQLTDTMLPLIYHPIGYEEK